MIKTEFENNENLDHDFSENYLKAKTIAKEKRGSKKLILALFILIILIALSLICIYIVVPVVQKSIAYNNGISLMDEGKYYDAYVSFSTCSGYKDTENLTISCVQKLMDEKDYTDAFECITQNEELARNITVKEEDYADLGAFIDKRLISAFSKNRYDAFQDVIACYDLAANEVLPNDYGNVKAYIDIGLSTTVMYDSYNNDEEFFLGMSSQLCDLLKSNPKSDLIKRILEQDNLIMHFLSGETREKRLKNTTSGNTCYWYNIISGTTFGLYLLDDNIRALRNGSWDDYTPEADRADYYSIKNATYYVGFKDETQDDIPQFTITINDYDVIAITSCSTNKTMTLIRHDNPFT